MPVSFEIDRAAGIVHTTLAGPVDTSELEAALVAVIHHPDFRPGLDGVVDLRQSEYRPGPQDVRQLADRLALEREHILPSRTALVVSRDVDYGMARMYQVYGEQAGITTGIFWDMDKALQWLNRSAESRH